MTYYVTGTLVCDLCGTTVKEEKQAWVCAPIAQPEIVNYQLDGIKATLCGECVYEMREAWNLYVCKLRKEGRLKGFRDYRQWSTAE